MRLLLLVVRCKCVHTVENIQPVMANIHHIRFQAPETTEALQATPKATMVTIHPLTCTESIRATAQPTVEIDAPCMKPSLADLTVAKFQAVEATRTEAPTVPIHTVVIQSQPNTKPPVPIEPAPNLQRNKANTTSNCSSRNLHLHASRNATDPDQSPVPGPSAPDRQHHRLTKPPYPHRLSREKAQRTHYPYIPVVAPPVAPVVELCQRRLLGPSYKRFWAKSVSYQPL